MATSGTTGLTQIEVAALVEHIGRRCGVTTEALTPEIIQSVKNVMFMFLTSLANRGINMWRVQRGLFGLNEGQATYIMPSGTLDILSANYRQPRRLGGVVSSSVGGTVENVFDGDVDTVFTQAGTNGYLQWAFTEETMVNLVGLMAGATGTNTLTFEVSADNGNTWSAVRTPGATAMIDGRWKWFNIEPAKSTTYFRIRETGGGTLSLREAVVASEWSETQIWRMNRDDFINIPSKRTLGDPRQYWFDRQSSSQIVFWPTPAASSIFNLVSLYSHMQVQDIGNLSNTLDIPQRWYEATVANCAFMALLEIPGSDLKRYDMLKDQATMSMTLAEAEERDASPSQFMPNIGAYTA